MTYMELSQEIKNLSAAEFEAEEQLRRAERAYKQARKEYLVAEAELESIRCCAAEFRWQIERCRESVKEAV